MNAEELGLLAEIEAAPGGDPCFRMEPIIIYSDYLEERGNPLYLGLRLLWIEKKHPRSHKMRTCRAGEPPAHGHQHSVFTDWTWRRGIGGVGRKEPQERKAPGGPPRL
jgi:hypothetical protein